MRGSFLVACPFRFSAADIGEDSTHGPCDRADRHRRDWAGSDRAPPRMSSASLRSEANYPAAERSPRTRLRIEATVRHFKALRINHPGSVGFRADRLL